MSVILSGAASGPPSALADDGVSEEKDLLFVPQTGCVFSIQAMTDGERRDKTLRKDSPFCATSSTTS
jgi:hypothetical protein